MAKILYHLKILNKNDISFFSCMSLAPSAIIIVTKLLPVGEMDKHDAICCPSVVNTVINDALCPISQCGNVNSRHWLITARRCVVREISDFGSLVSLYCQTNNFRPDIAQLHPLSEQLIDTFVLASVNINASLTTIGNCEPNVPTTLLAERAIQKLLCAERFEMLYRLH